MALGWLMNLDFAGSGVAGGAPTGRGNMMMTGLGIWLIGVGQWVLSFLR